MNTIRIGICDNSVSDCEILSLKLQKAASELECNFQIQHFPTGSSFLENYELNIDILFLDYNMPDVNSVKISQELRKRDALTYLILLLSRDGDSFAYSNAFKCRAENYLIKPYRYKTLLEELKQYLKYDHLASSAFMWGSCHQTKFKIYFTRILFIETATGEKKLIFHYNGTCFKITGNITEMMQQLPEQTFFRYHQSYIVNLNCIQTVFPGKNGYYIELVTGQKLPLSRGLRKELLSRLETLSEQRLKQNREIW